jgi:hypothetical protein
MVVATSTLAVAGQHIVGGTKYTGNTIPWWGSYTAGRFHCMWYQREINEAGDVTQIEFQFHSYSGTRTFNNVDMLLCHSRLSALTSNYTTNYAGNTPVKVYSGNYVIPSGLVRDQWVVQCSPTNFKYNNTDNLLFEISWQGRSASGGNYFWRATAGQPGRVWASSKTATSGSLYVNQGEIARITIGPIPGVAPTSLGRVKSLFR